MWDAPSPSPGDSRKCSQCTKCSNLTTAATTDAPVSSQVQNCLQKCLSKTVDKKSSRWSLWGGAQTRVRIYWPEWERSWSRCWQKQTGGVCCVVKQRSSTSSTSSSVSWWLTAQHSQVTRTARPYRTTQYCMEYVCHLSLSFNFRTFFLQKIVLDCDKSLKVSLGQTLVNLSKYQRSIRRLCILIQWMGPILTDISLLCSQLFDRDQHEYSICISWSENPIPPRNFSCLSFSNKIGNQRSRPAFRMGRFFQLSKGEDKICGGLRQKIQNMFYVLKLLR